MGDDVGECGGCFSQLVPLRVTATHVGGACMGDIIGKQCPNCGRTYLDELLAGVEIRLDRATYESTPVGDDDE